MRLRVKWLTGVVLASVFTLSGHALAQVNDTSAVEQPAPSVITRAMGGFTMGLTHLDVGPLNELTANDQFRRVDPTFVTLGGWGAMALGRMVLTVDGYAYLPEGSTTDGHMLETTGGRGFLGLGYAFVDTRRWHVFPSLSVGLGATEVSFHGPEGAMPSFVAEGVSVERCASLDVMTAASLFTSYSLSDAVGRWKPMVSLHAGYAYSIARTKWYSQGHWLEDLPQLDQSGPYLMLGVGAAHMN